jgi:hypothetical protein
MTPGLDALHERAREFGYVSSNCDGCDATGRSMKLAPDRADGGAPVEAVCPQCGGTGRWWYPEQRRTGVPTGHLTDVGLRHALRRAARQEVRRAEG